jgi:hypothetical protein
MQITTTVRTTSNAHSKWKMLRCMVPAPEHSVTGSNCLLSDISVRIQTSLQFLLRTCSDSHSVFVIVAINKLRPKQHIDSKWCRSRSMFVLHRKFLSDTILFKTRFWTFYWLFQKFGLGLYSHFWDCCANKQVNNQPSKRSSYNSTG